MHYQLGFPPQTLTQETFREKFLGTSKASPKINCCVRVKFLRIFKGLFSKSSLKQGLERQFQLLTKNKKRGVNRVFSCALNVWASAPNPDTRNFSRKVSWNFKSFRKNKRGEFGAKVLWPTFLSRKVGFNKTVQS